MKAERTVCDCAASQTQWPCDWPDHLILFLNLYPFFLLLSLHSHSLGFNCFEAERAPQGAQQDVLQSFGETDY